MKRFGLTLAILASLAGVGLFSRAVLAEENQPATQAQISKIVANCGKLEVEIRKIRSNDAVKRVALGEKYEHISNNLMAKLNARIALNRLNGAELLTVAAEFDQNFKYFKTNYQLYEHEITDLTKINCASNPEDFYAKLQKARQARKELSFNTTKLDEIAKKYAEKVAEFKKEAQNEK